VPLTQRIWIWHALITQNLIGSNYQQGYANWLLLELDIPFEKSITETERRAVSSLQNYQEQLAGQDNSDSLLIKYHCCTAHFRLSLL